MITTKKTIHIMLAGAVQTGKTVQIERAFNLQVQGPDGEVCHPFRPALFISIAGDAMSAAGTASAMLTDPMCDHITVGSVDEVRDAIQSRIAKGHASGQPYRLVAIDSWSAIRDTACAEVVEQAVQEGASRNVVNRPQASIAYNARDQAARAKPALDRVINAMMAQMTGVASVPRLFISTCHTEDNFEGPENARIKVGTKLRLMPSIQHKITASANIIWHTVRIDPDYSRYSPEKINECDLSTYYAIYTRPGAFPVSLRCEWIKFQAVGHMSAFGLVPVMWRDPDLAAPLAYMLASQHGLIASPIGDDAGNVIGYTLNP